MTDLSTLTSMVLFPVALCIGTPDACPTEAPQVIGRSLNDIGILPCEAFPQGQAGMEHEVSPNYYR